MLRENRNKTLHHSFWITVRETRTGAKAMHIGEDTNHGATLENLLAVVRETRTTAKVVNVACEGARHGVR